MIDKSKKLYLVWEKFQFCIAGDESHVDDLELLEKPVSCLSIEDNDILAMV